MVQGAHSEKTTERTIRGLLGVRCPTGPRPSSLGILDPPGITSRAMPSAEAFENSSSFLNGVAQAAREVGAWEDLQGSLGPEVLAVLKAPHQRRWWPGTVVLDITEALERVGGLQLVERVGYLAVKKSIAVVAMPLVRVTLALAGPAPDTILSRASMFGVTALRGVSYEWRRESPSSGVF